MTSTMTTAADLTAAADLLEQKGHVRRTFVVAGVGMCLDGALRQATMHRAVHVDKYTLRYEAALGVLVDLVPFDLCAGCDHQPLYKNSSVWHYNDFHCDGAVQAVALLRSAAEVASLRAGAEFLTDADVPVAVAV